MYVCMMRITYLSHETGQHQPSRQQRNHHGILGIHMLSAAAEISLLRQWMCLKGSLRIFGEGEQ